MNWMVAMGTTYFLLVLLAGSVFLGGFNGQNVLEAAKLPIALLAGMLLWLFYRALTPFDPGPWDSHEVWVGLLKTGMYFSIFVLVLTLVRSRAQLEGLLWAIVIVGLVQVLIKLSSGNEGTYVNRNHFAGYLEMALACAIGLMLAKLSPSGSGNWREAGRQWIQVFLGPKLVIRILILLLVVGLVMSQSRMGNLAFFCESWYSRNCWVVDI